jgi:hypothetical protein
MSAERTYPYKAWTLQPSFKPVEVEFTSLYRSFTGNDEWDVTSTGKSVHISEIFDRKEAAIAAGWERIHAQEAKLVKLGANLDKRRIALAKAGGAA